MLLIYIFFFYTAPFSFWKASSAAVTGGFNYLALLVMPTFRMLGQHWKEKMGGLRKGVKEFDSSYFTQLSDLPLMCIESLCANVLLARRGERFTIRRFPQPTRLSLLFPLGTPWVSPWVAPRYEGLVQHNPQQQAQPVQAPPSTPSHQAVTLKNAK